MIIESYIELIVWAHKNNKYKNYSYDNWQQLLITNITSYLTSSGLIENNKDNKEIIKEVLEKNIFKPQDNQYFLNSSLL
ncbi:MAG TPA: hypothetical protein PKV21_01355 [bacterium]|nr:hypothetical protein [bacterium]HOM26136.1 hypothetical protein [bacterium]